MRDLGVWNCALMGKLIWRLYEGNETLWIKWIHHYYLRNLDIWEWKPNRDASPMVKFLASSRDRIVEATGSLDMAKDFLQRAMGGARIQAKKSSPSGILYNLLRLKCAPRPWASIVWSSPSTPKHSYILWLATLGRLRTKDRIDFLEIDSTCVFCKSSPETIDHLFFVCSFTSSIWRIVRNWTGITRQINTLKMALKWLKKEKCSTCWITKLRRHALASTVYFLWCARNRAIFENDAPQLHTIVRRIQIHVFSIIYDSFPHVEGISFAITMN